MSRVIVVEPLLVLGRRRDAHVDRVTHRHRPSPGWRSIDQRPDATGALVESVVERLRGRRSLIRTVVVFYR
jgi:hypothetical protein